MGSLQKRDCCDVPIVPGASDDFGLRPPAGGHGKVTTAIPVCPGSLKLA